MSLSSSNHLAVVPILVGPLQVFLAMLPAILFGIGSALLALFKPATFKLALRLLWRMKVSIVVAIVLVSGTVFAARAVWRGAGAVRQAEAGAHDWPLFRGNARRTGAAESGGAPLEGGVNWAFASEAKTFYSSPTVVGNRVYATSAEVGVFSNRGAIYCLDADTGGVVWKSVPEGMRATFSSPSVSGKYLVTGEGLHQVRDGRVTCLDITRGGAVLWTFRTKSHVESSPAIADGRAIVGAGDDGYYCFRLEPDAKGEPVLLWHLPGSQYHDAENDPIVHEGRAYLGLGINGQAIVCVDAASGRELWRVATSAPVFSPPTIARGKLFIGMGHGDFVNSEEVVIANEVESLRAAGKSPAEIEEAKARLQPGGEAWCIDLATHQVDWKYKTDSSVLGAVVAGEDRLFIASRAGTVYSVGFDGKPLATWNAHAAIIASLALTASHVYAVTESGRLFALEQSGLQPVWETRLGNAGTFLSSPAIARGHIYAGTPEDGLLCVGRPAGQSEAKLWAGELGGAGAGGNPENASLPETGEIVWRWGGPDSDQVTGPAAALDHRLFVPIKRLDFVKGDGVTFAVGPPRLVRYGVVCLRADGPTNEAPVEQWFTPASNEVTSSPGASKAAVVFSDGKPGMTGRRLHYLSSTTGAEEWSASIAPKAYGFACLTPDAVVAEVEPGSLTSFDLSGRVRWQRSLGPPSSVSYARPIQGPPVITEGLLIAATDDALIAIDELEGGILWRSPMTAAVTGPIRRGNLILVGTNFGIEECEIIDGARAGLMSLAGNPVVSPLVRCGSFLAVIVKEESANSGSVNVFDPESGDHAEQYGVIPNIPPLPAKDALLVAVPDGWMRLNLADKSYTRWLKIETTGEAKAISSPAILSGSSIYFSGDGGRLIRADGRSGK